VLALQPRRARLSAQGTPLRADARTEAHVEEEGISIAGHAASLLMDEHEFVGGGRMYQCLGLGMQSRRWQ
jgi:hypothetical protein